MTLPLRGLVVMPRTYGPLPAIGEQTAAVLAEFGAKGAKS